MPEEKQQSAFEKLAEGLPEQHRAEFFKHLHEAGVSPNDLELARLLCVLQLYKAYYEAIPDAVQKIASGIEKVKSEVEGFSRDAHQSADASARLAGEVIQETERVRKDLAKIHEQIEKRMAQSSEKIVSKVTQLLIAEISKDLLLPLKEQMSNLAGSSKSFGDAIAQSGKAVEMLRDNVKVIRRAYLWTYGLCGILIVCALFSASWLYLHHLYSEQMEQERVVLIGQVKKNREVLLELAKSRRTLEFVQDPSSPNRKYLVMKDASGWQSAGKYGVIEFNK